MTTARATTVPLTTTETARRILRARANATGRPHVGRSTDGLIREWPDILGSLAEYPSGRTTVREWIMGRRP